MFNDGSVAHSDMAVAVDDLADDGSIHGGRVLD